MTPTAWPNPRYAWYVVCILTLAQTLSFVDQQILALLVGPLKAEFHLSDTQISLLGGPAFALFYTVMGVPLGRLSDRNNRTLIISCGVFLWSLDTMSCGLAKGFWTLFLVRMGVGVCVATLSPGAYSLIADYFPPDKLTRPTSLYLTGVWFGTGLAFILGGALIDMVTTMGTITVPVLGDLKTWQVVFFCVGAPGLLSPLVMLTVREAARRSKIEAVGVVDVDVRTALAYVWAHRRTYAPMFASLGLYAAYGLDTSFWTIEFFSRAYAIDRSTISYTYGTMCFVFETAGSMSAGWVVEWFERRGHADAKVLTAYLGIAAMIPFAALFPLMPSPLLAAIGVAGVVFCTPFPYGPSVAALQNVTPNKMRGFVSGLYLFVAIVLGLGVGPTLIALMTDFVFRSDALLNYSLAATAALLIPAATFCMHMARKPFAASLSAAAVWTER